MFGQKVLIGDEQWPVRLIAAQAEVLELSRRCGLITAGCKSHVTAYRVLVRCSTSSTMVPPGTMTGSTSGVSRRSSRSSIAGSVFLLSSRSVTAEVSGRQGACNSHRSLPDVAPPASFATGPGNPLQRILPGAGGRTRNLLGLILQIGLDRGRALGTCRFQGLHEPCIAHKAEEDCHRAGQRISGDGEFFESLSISNSSIEVRRRIRATPQSWAKPPWRISCDQAPESRIGRARARRKWRRNYVADKAVLHAVHQPDTDEFVAVVDVVR